MGRPALARTVTLFRQQETSNSHCQSMTCGDTDESPVVTAGNSINIGFSRLKAEIGYSAAKAGGTASGLDWAEDTMKSEIRGRISARKRDPLNTP